MSDTARLLAEVAALRADFAAANAPPVTVVDRTGFAGMSPMDKMEFVRRGGRVNDAAPSTAPGAAIDLERHRRQLHEAREATIRANLAAGLRVAPPSQTSSVEKALAAAARGDTAAARAMVKDRGAAFAVMRSAPGVGRQIVGAEYAADFDRSAAFV